MSFPSSRWFLGLPADVLVCSVLCAVLKLLLCWGCLSIASLRLPLCMCDYHYSDGAILGLLLGRLWVNPLQLHPPWLVWAASVCWADLQQGPAVAARLLLVGACLVVMGERVLDEAVCLLGQLWRAVCCFLPWRCGWYMAV